MKEYMNSKIKHGGISSAIHSPKLKTNFRIKSPSDVLRAIKTCDFIERISWELICECISVLFGNKSVLRNNFARSSGTRLRALLINVCESTSVNYQNF